MAEATEEGNAWVTSRNYETLVNGIFDATFTHNNIIRDLPSRDALNSGRMLASLDHLWGPYLHSSCQTYGSNTDLCKTEHGQRSVFDLLKLHAS